MAFVRIIVCLLAVSGFADSGVAQTATSSAGAVVSDPAKFFLFSAGDQSADQFRGDLIYCIDQAKPVLSDRDREPSMGLLGALINGRMANIDRFRMRNAVMRKCMGMLGYSRYAVSEIEWKRIVKDGDIVVNDKGEVDPAVVENMVAFATGPKPDGKVLPR